MTDNTPPDSLPSAFATVASAKKAASDLAAVLARLEQGARRNDTADALLTPSIVILKEVCRGLADNQIKMAEHIAALEDRLDKLENPRPAVVNKPRLPGA